MKAATVVLCVGVVAVVWGCTNQSAVDQSETAVTATTSATDAAGSSASEATGTRLELTPENTSIEFVGNHTGDDPDPRQGKFEQFSGSAVIDGTLKSVAVQIETPSLSTDIEKLTNHLKNADFFDVNRYPTAKFESKAIKDLGNGQIEISGDLTLLDTTRSISFPATFGTEGTPLLEAEFEIDRTQWGMSYGPDKIEKLVPMKITIGG